MRLIPPLYPRRFMFRKFIWIGTSVFCILKFIGHFQIKEEFKIIRDEKELSNKINKSLENKTINSDFFYLDSGEKVDINDFKGNYIIIIKSNMKHVCGIFAIIWFTLSGNFSKYNGAAKMKFKSRFEFLFCIVNVLVPIY